MNAEHNFSQGFIPNPATVQELPVSLEELYNGSLRKIKVSKKTLDAQQETTSLVDKIITIEIQKGWKDGTKLTFPAKGDQGPHQLPGDIVFVLKQQKHKVFHRMGDDLIYTHQIPLLEALTGTVLDIETLDGRCLKIPINDTISPHYVKSIPQEGMPLSKNPQQRGQLRIKFETVYPAYLTEEQKQLLKKAL